MWAVEREGGGEGLTGWVVGVEAEVVDYSDYAYCACAECGEGC